MAASGSGAPRPLRLLFATWDGAGNLPPTLALVEAFARRGHAVHVLGHAVQKPQIEAAGGAFIGFETAPQLDQGQPRTMGDDPIAWFVGFEAKAADDFRAAAARLDPDAALVDCMLPAALTASKSEGRKTVALVHALYSFFAEYAGGLFRAPIDEADLALSLSYEAFDRGTRFPPNLRFIGPLRPRADEAKWVRRRPGRPLVVVSLSTGLQGPGSSQQDLLQRVCDAVAELPLEALVTTGRGIAPESLVLGVNTRAVRRVPHEAVLRQADLMVTHAGHGTVMVAATLGAPMLCLPPNADQPYNAARVAELGLGAVLDPASPSRDIRAAVSRLIDDPALKERSRAFAAAVADHPGVETAVALVESLVA
jgi:UDP:flavonoid glycosyltransferase YjiC (YdhE family)